MEFGLSGRALWHSPRYDLRATADEWKEWLDLSPLERFRRSEEIFAQYLAMRQP